MIYSKTILLIVFLLDRSLLGMENRRSSIQFVGSNHFLPFVLSSSVTTDPITSIINGLDRELFNRLPIDIKKLILTEIIENDSFSLIPSMVKKIEGVALTPAIKPQLSKNSHSVLVGSQNTISLINLANDSIITLCFVETDMLDAFLIENDSSLLIGYHQGYGTFPLLYAWNITTHSNRPLFKNNLHSSKRKSKISGDGHWMANRWAKSLEVINSSELTSFYISLQSLKSSNEFEGICNFTWDRNNNLIIITSKRLLVYDQKANKEIKTIDLDHLADFDGEIIIAENGNYLSFVHWINKSLIVVDLQKDTYTHKDILCTPLLFTNDHYLIVLNTTHTVEVLDILTHLTTVATIPTHDIDEKNRNALRVACIPQTNFIAIGTLDKPYCHLWNYKNGNYLGGLQVGNDTVIDIIPLKDSQLLICGHKSVQIWELNQSWEQLLALKFLRQAVNQRSHIQFYELMESNFIKSLPKKSKQYFENIFFYELSNPNFTQLSKSIQIHSDKKEKKQWARRSPLFNIRQTIKKRLNFFSL